MSSQNKTVAPTELSHEEVVKVGCDGQCEFDPPLESKYKCPICLLGLREPVQTSCGHRFCRSCIVRSIRDDDPICPVDNEPLSESQIYPDKFAEREMMTFLVFCRAKKQNGCLWKGPLTKLEDHLNECPFVVVNCTNDCGKQLQQKDLQQHMSTECLFRNSPCDYCGDAVLWNEVQQHFESCSKYPQQCDKCKEEGIERDKMEFHLEQQCPNVKIKCPLDMLGCPFEGLRADVNKHIKDQLSSHVGACLRYVRDRTKSEDDFPQKQAGQEGSLIRQQQGEIEELKHVVTWLTNTVRDLEQQLKEAQTGKERPVHERKQKLLQQEGRFCNGTYTWRIENFTQCCQDAISGACTAKYSPAFYTSLYGYKLCMRINLNGVDDGVGKHIALFVHLMQGDYDDFLEWPFSKKFRLSIVDQTDDEEPHHDISKILVAEPERHAFQRPMAPYNYRGFGYQEFATIEMIHKPQYTKNNTFLVKFEIIAY